MFLQSAVQGIRDFWAPVLRSSRFTKDAVLTPEEFVAAGDHLVFKCRTWTWESGDSTKRRDYLPPNKQFLVTRNVPCVPVSQTMELVEVDLSAHGGSSGWVTTATSEAAAGLLEEDSDMEFVERELSNLPPLNKLDHPKYPLLAPASSSSYTPFDPTDTKYKAKDKDKSSGCCSGSRIPDMEDLAAGVVDHAFYQQQQDKLAAASKAILESKETSGAPPSKETSTGTTVLLTRTYDMSIVYDKYYQTPKLFLAGYDEHRRALPPTAALSDVSADHANKTVTLEAHPHLADTLVASIHPCRHAEAMKRRMDDRRARNLETSVELYLILFLKFMSSVLPELDYDHTLPVD